MSKHSNKLSLLILSALLLCLGSCRHSDYELENSETITDLGGGTGTVTWSSDTEYLLNGFVFVNDGQTLTIEAGCVIRSRTGQGSLASALIVARGGRIIAEGRSDAPIIFTVEGDDLEGSIPLETRGLWGGLIILGNAQVNTETGEDMIEGIPISEPRGIYGGNDVDDNSGILRYISIRHGGTNIGEGNEINGLTLGGVGRQTTIEYIEVISNADDGVEFFGGSVNCRNMVVAFCGDDAFDLDQGYQGKGQFWLGINSADSDQGMEISGGLQPVQALPEAFPSIFNATLIANQSLVEKEHSRFQSYGGALLANSIFLEPGKGIHIEYAARAGDSWSLFESGRLSLKGNVVHLGSTADTAYMVYSETEDISADMKQELADSTLSWLTSYDDPGLSSSPPYKLLPPTTVFPDMIPNGNDWFETVTYKGAFGSNNWIEAWTLLHASGLTYD